MWATLIATLALSLIGGVFSASGVKHLPSYLAACKKDDPNLKACCLASARAGIPSLLKGDKKYGIPNFKPLKIDQIQLNNPTLKLKFYDVSLWGIDEADLQDVDFNLKNQKVEIKFKTPQIQLIGKYESDGKILVLPLKGNGNFNITFENVYIDYFLDYKLIQKGDYEYLNIAKSDLTYTMTKARFSLENLFNGNEQLSKSTNEVLNNEWEAVMEELSPTIKNTIRTIATSIIDNVAKRIPFEFFFL